MYPLWNIAEKTSHYLINNYNDYKYDDITNACYLKDGSFYIPTTIEWNYFGLSYNPNTTMDMIENNPDKDWNWEQISQNPFTRDKKLFFEKKMHEYLAAYRIQQYYWKAITNPHNTIGFNKINKDFDKLFTTNNSLIS